MQACHVGSQNCHVLCSDWPVLPIHTSIYTYRSGLVATADENTSSAVVSAAAPDAPAHSGGDARTRNSPGSKLCEYCRRTFESRGELMAHKVAVHPLQYQQVEVHALWTQGEGVD